MPKDIVNPFGHDREKMMSSFGDELRRLMAEKGFTQQRLANACGVNQSFIAKLALGGRDRFGADVLFALCNALEVSCEHFKPFITPSGPAPTPPVAPPPPAVRRVASKRK